MKMTTEAGKWLAENDGQKFDRMAHWGKHKHARTDFAAHLRKKAKQPMTAKAFVEANRHAKSAECIFVPDARDGAPTRVKFLDRTISAARYMALLTYGAPRNEGAVVRHLCGNGHLSCVNPAHLEWGSASANSSDASKHRGCETAQDRIHSLNGKR